MAPAVFAVAVVAGCLAALYAGFRGVAWLFERLCGWNRLQAVFGCEAERGVWTRRGETIRVNAIRFRRCADVGVRGDGLYLRVGAIFRFGAIRVPWDQISMVSKDTVYGRPAMGFSIPGGRIVVDLPLYAEIYEHLGAARG